ncbi:MAG: YicC family protein [Planctomycetota bacterium]|nr:YicC family protein [Planctomycetota bacterium]MDA0918691.1 YicC family protein [Planctomycetota bacterium]MDA1158137.1 YicC family protein [Planctomycetota bacterium]
MTGFGSASGQSDRFTASVEIKAVNNRHLKVSTRLPDVLGSLEPLIEKTVREAVARGTVSVSVRFSAVGQASRYQISSELLTGYWNQLRAITQTSGVPLPEVNALLTLPGVISDELSSSLDAAEEWPFLEGIVSEALGGLNEFRQREGESMRAELQQCCEQIATNLESVIERAPEVVNNYRDKVLERVRELLEGSGATVEPDNLIREVSVFADRCDINEEITRLRCHIDEFLKVINGPTSQGRKLDFLSQEMFREINTTGSKASNVEIAHHVVEMKAAVEKIREILGNVE